MFPKGKFNILTVSRRSQSWLNCISPLENSKLWAGKRWLVARPRQFPFDHWSWATIDMVTSKMMGNNPVGSCDVGKQTCVLDSKIQSKSATWSFAGCWNGLTPVRPSPEFGILFSYSMVKACLAQFHCFHWQVLWNYLWPHFFSIATYSRS